MKKFSPMLASNQQVDLSDIQYPLLASCKLDGVRCIFYKGEILSRSLKQIQNKQLREKFESIRQYSEDYDLILDGEIYSHNLNFQEIISFCMTKDFEDKKSIKKYGEVKQIPKHLKFYCFDAIKNNEFDEDFSLRYANDVLKIEGAFPRLANSVYHKKVNTKEEVEKYFEEVLKEGYEGLILRSFDGRYKCGRGTIREGLIYKVKPFRTFDGEIIDVIQSTEVDPNVEKKINELGRSVTSKKKENRILINKASCFAVKYEGLDLKVVIAMTDEEKEEIWINKESYIGKIIEYKGMMIGSKDVPRHPVMIRFRDDKE